jgi:hypothetical protein
VKRRTSSQQQNNVVVGWVEVWSTTPGEGFAVEGVVPLKLSRLTARRRKRKPLAAQGRAA